VQPKIQKSRFSKKQCANVKTEGVYLIIKKYGGNMKKKKICNKVLLLILLSSVKINCYQTTSLFMKPHPTIVGEKTAIKKVQKLKKLPKAAKYVFRAFTKPFLTSGIPFSSGGNYYITDLNGQVVFIRTHKKPFVTIIITKNIVPVLSLENTVHHWELSRRRNVKIYTAERKLDVPSKTYFWDVKEAPIPKDNIIPINAIVIFANPKYVYMPTGITITTKNPQLVLPDIYIKPGINKAKSALLLFNVKNLLATTKSMYKKGKMRYSRHLKN